MTWTSLVDSSSRRAVVLLVVAALFALLPTVGTPRAARSESGRSDRIDAFFDEAPHAVFERVSAEGFSDRVAIHAPVHIDGTEGVLQPDTGPDVTLLEGDGVVGHLVPIDHPGQRLAIIESGTAPRWLPEQNSWAEAKLRDAEFLPHVERGAERVGDLFLDAGSSALDIAVDLEDRVERTGCSGPEGAASTRTGRRWGSDATIVGAPARGPLAVGVVKIDRPEVYYLAEQPSLFGVVEMK